MKRPMMTMVAAALCVSAHSFDMSKAGFHERGGAHVDSGVEVQTEDMLLDPTARFVKTGQGELDVPLSRIDGQLPYRLDVLGGTLGVSAGADAAADVALPPDVCQRAAFWVSPDSAVVTGGTFVARWCDVREPTETRGLSASPSYLYATPGWYHPAEGLDGVPPVLETRYGRPTVYFGGHQSGVHMTWSRTVGKIRAIFLVHGVFDTFGAAIGYTVASRKGGFIPQFGSKSTVSRAAATYYLNSRTDLTPETHGMAAFLDGKAMDVTVTQPPEGFQLLECIYTTHGTQADAFFFTHFEQLWGADSCRQGGDCISEAIVFTNSVTEAERLAVERYLMRKWSLPANPFAESASPEPISWPKPVGTVGAASGATVKVSAGDGEATAPLAFVGEGAVVKEGAGTLVAGRPAEDGPFGGTFELSAGDVVARGGGRLPPLTLSAGSRYTAQACATEAEGNATPELTAQAGLRLIKSADVPAGSVVKDGDGWARANGVAPGVTSIIVTDGVLQLEGRPVTALYRPGGVVTAVVSNADFEMPFTDVDSKGWSAGLAGNTVNGWTGSGFLRYVRRG